MLDIDRSHLYYQSLVQLDDTELINRILEIYAERPAYGYRKICVLLREEGFLINKKKVHRLMQFLQIRSVAPGPNTFEPSKDNHGYPYLLKGFVLIGLTRSGLLILRTSSCRQEWSICLL